MVEVTPLAIDWQHLTKAVGHLSCSFGITVMHITRVCSEQQDTIIKELCTTKIKSVCVVGQTVIDITWDGKYSYPPNFCSTL